MLTNANVFKPHAKYLWNRKPMSGLCRLSQLVKYSVDYKKPIALPPGHNQSGSSPQGPTRGGQITADARRHVWGRGPNLPLVDKF